MSVEDEILNWIHGRLSSQQSFLGDLPPCPYAAEATLRGQIQISVISNEIEIHNLEDCIQQEISHFANKSFRVHVIAVPTWQNISVDSVKKLVQKQREISFKKDIWLLYDHPSDTEVVQDFSFNHGSMLLFFIQKLSDLVLASEELAKTAYYDHWPKNYKIELLEQRAQYYHQYLALQFAPSCESTPK
jgi:hypothetical protein